MVFISKTWAGYSEESLTNFWSIPLTSLVSQSIPQVESPQRSGCASFLTFLCVSLLKPGGDGRCSSLFLFPTFHLAAPLFTLFCLRLHITVTHALVYRTNLPNSRYRFYFVMDDCWLFPNIIRCTVSSALFNNCLPLAPYFYLHLTVTVLGCSHCIDTKSLERRALNVKLNIPV